ncbi:MAG: manganese catalase family protein, partial [Herminiimonas sp.]|nr:manganese catalase family protein [Herminiimonas sp.]
MFAHYKRLQYMVRAAGSIPELVNLMLEQFGGPQGKLAAACRYFTQALGENDPAHAQMTQTEMAATKTMALRARSDPGLDYLAGAEVGAGGTEPTSAAAPRRYRRQGPCHQYIDISRRSVTV